MAIKKGYPLKDVAEFPSELIEQLACISITTIEEFLSTWSLNREYLLEYLNLSEIELHKFVSSAQEYLDEETLAKIRDFEPPRRPLGAKSPYSEEFQKYKDNQKDFNSNTSNQC